MRIFLFLSLVLAGCFAKAVSFMLPVTVTASGTSTMVMAPNGFRSYLLIQNTGSNPVIVKIGAVQSANEGIIIAAGGAYEPIQAPTNGIWLKETAGASTVVLVQGQ